MSLVDECCYSEELDVKSSVGKIIENVNQTVTCRGRKFLKYLNVTNPPQLPQTERQGITLTYIHMRKL